jgi:hypothetical protein
LSNQPCSVGCMEGILGMVISYPEEELPCCSSAGLMSSPRLVNASDQEQGQADSAIAVGQLFITGNCA